MWRTPEDEEISNWYLSFDPVSESLYTDTLKIHSGEEIETYTLSTVKI